MGANTKISWADHTFNPVWGCTKVGPGCTQCYAEALDRRTGGDHWGPGKPRRRTSEKNWNEPRRWNRQAEKTGVRPKIFCASMADVFDNEWPSEWRTDLWALIRETPNLCWLLLTKRSGNVPKMLPDDWGDGWPHVWLGATVVNQEEADRDVSKLRAVPATIRFLSIEPMLAPITPDLEKIDWTIVGAESGPKRRPMNEDWVRSLRDQCAAAGTAFFYKQNIINGQKVECPTLDGRQHIEFPLRGKQ